MGPPGTGARVETPVFCRHLCRQFCLGKLPPPLPSRFSPFPIDDNRGTGRSEGGRWSLTSVPTICPTDPRFDFVSGLRPNQDRREGVGRGEGTYGDDSYMVGPPCPSGSVPVFIFHTYPSFSSNCRVPISSSHVSGHHTSHTHTHTET